MLKDLFVPARVLPAATPRMLAFIRIFVCAILLTNALWENVASSALLPVGLRRPEGVIWLFQSIAPRVFHWLCSTAWALGLLQAATVVALISALIGFRTRPAVLCAAVLSVLMGGLLRQYAWFYHAGLFTTYALIVLAFTPCGVAWSVDRWRTRRRGGTQIADDEPRAVDAWSVYAVWIAVAVPYVMAGLSKVRAGAGWFDPLNFKSILLADTLNPMHFDFDYSLRITWMPDWIFGVMAVGAAAGEMAMASVLFLSMGAPTRPPVMIGMHIAVWLLQRVFFFDLMLLPLIFVVPPRWFGGSDVGPRSTFAASRWPRPILLLLLAFAMIWIGRVKSFPASDMPMYAGVNRSGVVEYRQLVGYLASGAMIHPRPDEVIPAMTDARYRRVLELAMTTTERRVARQFFATCGRLFNEQRPPADRLVAFEVIRKRWDFVHERNDPAFGSVVQRVRFDLAPD